MQSMRWWSASKGFVPGFTLITICIVNCIIIFILCGQCVAIVLTTMLVNNGAFKTLNMKGHQSFSDFIFIFNISCLNFNTCSGNLAVRRLSYNYYTVVMATQ